MRVVLNSNLLQCVEVRREAAAWYIKKNSSTFPYIEYVLLNSVGCNTNAAPHYYMEK